MDTQIFTDTLIGPHGETVGRWVKFEQYHNLLAERDALRAALVRSRYDAVMLRVALERIDREPSVIGQDARVLQLVAHDALTGREHLSTLEMSEAIRDFAALGGGK